MDLAAARKRFTPGARPVDPDPDPFLGDPADLSAEDLTAAIKAAPAVEIAKVTTAWKATRRIDPWTGAGEDPMHFVAPPKHPSCRATVAIEPIPTEAERGGLSATEYAKAARRGADEGKVRIRLIPGGFGETSRWRIEWPDGVSSFPAAGNDRAEAMFKAMGERPGDAPTKVGRIELSPIDRDFYRRFRAGVRGGTVRVELRLDPAGVEWIDVFGMGSAGVVHLPATLPLGKIVRSAWVDRGEWV